MLLSAMEAKINVKFFIKLLKSATDTLNMFRQDYGNEAMGRIHCLEWHNASKVKDCPMEDDQQSERPSMSITPENCALRICLSRPNHEFEAFEGDRIW